MAASIAGSQAGLEKKVEERTQALKHSLAAQAIAEERQRIMRDMHDGFGSQLISGVLLLERTQGSSREAAQLLRQCIDDLRLTIDAMTCDDSGLYADHAGALAALHDRMRPRIEAAGVVLRWDAIALAEELPDMPRRAPPFMQHGLNTSSTHPSGAREARK
jgi:signal transduction histidine kinase